MKLRLFSSFFVLMLLLSACNSTKFVPDGEYLLDKVEIKSDIKDIPSSELHGYIRQTPNAAVFSLFRMQLGVYNLAGKDTSKWINRTLKRMGDPPVIFNPALSSISRQQLQQFCENKGYIQAKTYSKVITKGKKAEVFYTITANKPYRLRNYNIDIKDSMLNQIANDSSRSLVRKNMLFDVDVFNAERERISSSYRQSGRYNFNKDFLSYAADSTLNEHKVDMTIELRDYLKDSIAQKAVLKKYSIRKVVYITNSLSTENDSIEEGKDTIYFRDFSMITPKKQLIKLDALVQNTFINPQSLYSDRAVERTYQALNSLGPIKYVNISFKEANDTLLDCFIVVAPTKAITISSEVEGTYTDGYWGAAWNLNGSHRNFLNGAETLSIQLRGAVESQETVWAKEFSAQVGLKFPKFIFPIGSYDFKRNIHANTEVTTAINYMVRPGEFTTTNLSAGVNYTWNRRMFRHRIQLIELSYVNFPYISPAFKAAYLDVVPPKFNPYTYEDHFIMRWGYSGSFSNMSSSRPLQNYSTARYGIDMAGNLLYGLSKAFGAIPDPSDSSYRFLNVRFAQYVKAEFNITHHQIFDKNNRFVYHIGAGVGVPYGNANIIPYEKRFYSGGANSVRGWSESTLGPGVYQRINSKRRDYNQVGDVKLDMNFEYRSKMFWVLEGAVFVDAGNIWTIKDYQTQKGGTFQFNTFAQQIALAYGFGLRFDFSFFIARVDLGVKLFNPAVSSSSQWRFKPTWSDDCAIHLAIGYPF